MAQRGERGGKKKKTSAHVLALAAHTNERALLILNAQMLAGRAVQHLERILVGVHHGPARNLVRVRLIHAHLPRSSTVSERERERERERAVPLPPPLIRQI
jgi:hypothetical protein